MSKQPMSEYEKRQQDEREGRIRYERRSEELAKIIKPLRTARYEVTAEWRRFERQLAAFGEDYEGLEMVPDFQRGHVWTQDQQRHYIENVMRGVVSTSGLVVQFNCPNWDVDDYKGDLPRGLQCIDGLQRITAVLGFLKAEVRPFGLTVEDLDCSAFSVKTNFNFRLAIHNFTSKADLLQHYLDLNAGGTPHAPEEIERVRALRESVLGGPERKGKGPGL